MRHPTVEVLIDHIENKWSSPGASDLDAHLEVCGTCRRKVAEFREVLEFLAEDGQNEPPRDLLDWAIGVFQPVLHLPKSASPRLRRIAKRVFDSFEQPVPAGARSAAGVSPRHLLYQADGIDVDVRVESSKDEDHLTLVGQILSEPRSPVPQNTRVVLASSDVSYDTLTNPVGEFSFDSVPKNTYHLFVDLPDGEVALFCVHRAAALR